jgi:hypothetical protein
MLATGPIFHNVWGFKPCGNEEYADGILDFKIRHFDGIVYIRHGRLGFGGYDLEMDRR